MIQANSVLTAPDDVRLRLEELELDEALLRDAVKEGVRFVLDCTKHDPLYLPGILGSGKIVRALRDRLVLKGWSYSNPRNYALTSNPSCSVAIAVAGGDVNTGIVMATPSTRTDKGPATRDAIFGNTQMQFSQVDPRFPQTMSPSSTKTWLLLFFIDQSNHETRMELSLPSGMDSDGYVTSWKERIIIGPEPFGLAAAMAPQPPKIPPIDIPVRRRATP